MTVTRAGLMVLGAYLAVSVSAASAADWPGWRGPNRDAVSLEQGLLQEWPAPGPPLLWKVTGVGAGWLRVNADVHRQSLLLAPDAVVTPWALAGFAGLTEDDFAPLLDLRPAVVVFGSGATLRFAHPRLTRALVAARIGVETMDTAAACRTYNILAAEGRRVAAALIVEGTAAPASPAAR